MKIKSSLISIIIVNYNTGTFVKECIESIRTFYNENEIEIIVVDNNSNSSPVGNLEKLFSGVRTFFLKENGGFARGCNFGAGKSSGEFLLFLNPDVKLYEDNIMILKNFMYENNECGVLSGTMLNEELNPIYFYNNFPDISWEFYHLLGFGYDRKIKKLLGRKEINDNKMFEADWFHGAFLFIRNKDFQKAGGFNENYFMYYEDVEICYQLKKNLQKKNICLPEVKFIHSTRSSIKEEKNDNLYSFHINRGKLLFIKNYPLIKRSIIHVMGFINIALRILILPIWKKYRKNKKEKFIQLKKIMKLYINRQFLIDSKFEYISNR